LWISASAQVADLLAEFDTMCISLPNADPFSWLGADRRPLYEWDEIALGDDRKVVLAFDADTNRDALTQLRRMFWIKGCDVSYLQTPSDTTAYTYLSTDCSPIICEQLPEMGRAERVAARLEWLQIQEEARRRYDQEQRGDERNTWLPMDLGPYLRNEIEQPKPTIGIRRQHDGQQFIYPAREHAVIGGTESGKTWFALACTAEQLAAGNRVLYIHFEEGEPGSTIERLRLLGVPDNAIAEQFEFVGPTQPVTPEQLDALLEMVPTLVVLDGVNEAMALIGADSHKDDGAAEFRRQFVRPCLEADAAVLACDHLPGSADGATKGAYGSVHKGNALDGARFILENFEPFGRGLRGASSMYVTKDRPGHLREHGRPTETPGKTLMGVLVADASDPFAPFELALYPPKDADPAVAVADTLIDDVFQVIYAQPEHTVASENILFAELRAAGIKAGDKTIQRAVADLIVAKRVVEVTGKRRARMYRAVTSAE